MNKAACLNDWRLFVNSISFLYSADKNQDDISLEFSGGCVEWEGTIRSIELGELYASGISMKMSPEFVITSNKQKILTDYLFLGVDKKFASKWADYEVGDRVKFTGNLAETDGPFPIITLSEDELEPEILLMVNVSCCKPIEHS